MSSALVELLGVDDMILGASTIPLTPDGFGGHVVAADQRIPVVTHGTWLVVRVTVNDKQRVYPIADVLHGSPGAYVRVPESLVHTP